MAGALRRLIPNFIRRSYVLKFGITLLILGLSIGAIGFVGTDVIRDQVTDNVNNDLGASSTQEAQTFQNWHDRNKLVVRNLAGSEAAASGNSFRMQEFVDQRTSNPSGIPDGRAIHYVDVENNQVTASSDGELSDRQLSGIDRPWAQRLAEATPTGQAPTGTLVFPGHVGDDGTPVLTYATRPEGVNSFIVVYEVDLSSYQSGVHDNERGTFVYIVDDSAGGPDGGEILYDSTASRYFDSFDNQELLQRSQTIPATAEPSQRVDGPFETDEQLRASVPEGFKNSEYVASYDRVSGTDYTIVVYTPQSQSYGFVTQISRFGTLATLAGVLLIGIIGAVLGRNTAAAIDRLRKKSEAMEQGNLDIDFDHDRIDNIGRLYDGMANMRDALRDQIMEARQAREEAELAREEAEETSRHLQAKANEYRDVMQAVAAGDLGQRMRPSERNEAMQGIAEEFNAMIAEIEATITQLKDFANEVATSSEEVTASSEEVRSASQQVTQSIQEISEGAERQNDSLQSVSREMSGLSTTVEEIASLSNEVADLSERTAETGRRGRDAAQDAIAGMNQIEEESEVAVDQIETLDEEMAQIDELIEFITDVANQTNMLALNANIEASRAGSGGDAEGFAVVANEVKELAEETKQAAEDIEERLELIQDQTEDTVESVRTTGERISEHTDSVRNAVEALDEIAGYAQETNTGVQEISAATEEQAASTEEVVAMVDEAATISERTSREAENVAAAAEEQTTAMTEVSDSASDLSQQASRLSEALDRFETGSAGSPAGDADEGIEEVAPPDVGEGFEGVEAEDIAAEFDDEALAVEEEFASGATEELPGEGTPGDAGGTAPDPDGESPVADLADEVGDLEAADAAPADEADVAGDPDEFEVPDAPAGDAGEPVEEFDESAGESDESGDAAPGEFEAPGVEELAEQFDDEAADEGDSSGFDQFSQEIPEGESELPDDPVPGEEGDATGDGEASESPGEADGAPDGTDPTDAHEGDESPAEASGDGSPAEAPGDDSPGDGETPAGIGDLAGDELEDADDETLGGTEPATFGDVSDEDEDPPDPDEDDMFSFADDAAEETRREGDDD